MPIQPKTSLSVSHPVTLRFAPHLERDFLAYHFAAYRKSMRAASIINLVIAIGMAFLAGPAGFVEPPLTGKSHLAVGICLTLCALYVVATHLRSRHPKYDTMIIGGTLILQLALTTVLLELPPVWLEAAFAVFMLQIVGNYISVGVRYREAVLLNAFSSLIYIALYWSTNTYPTIFGGPYMLISYFVIANWFGMSMARTQETHLRRTFILDLELQAEQQQSELLLLNVLPQKIAAELKSNAPRPAQFHADTTVLFADIVGFTTLAATRSARETVAILEALFCRFDDACEALGVEKIKTIGDAYMAVAGVPEAATDHAERIGDLALAIVSTVETYGADTGLNLQIRVGVHSGAVVAGVIGKKKFSYDLWGDTVNVASRMESTGVPGHIHVSSETRELLGSRFHFSEPRNVKIKGKGNATTYFLQGRAPQIAARPATDAKVKARNAA